MKPSAATVPWKVEADWRRAASFDALGTFRCGFTPPLLKPSSVTTSVLRRAPQSSKLGPRSVRDLAERMLAALELSEAELSILLTDDRGIQRLNHRHRGKDKPTDVLSFPLDDDPKASGQRLLGDVVISLDTAERQAKARHRPLLEEVRFLLAHGILHLIGYDHATRSQKRRMDAATKKLVRAAAGMGRRSTGQRRKKVTSARR